MLEARRVGAAHQHVEVVVGLHHQRAAAGELLHHVLGDAAEIRGDSEARAAVGEGVLHRLARVVGHRERVHLQAADGERRVGLDVAHQHGGEILRQPLRRAAREVDGNRIALGEACDAAHVVVMLVGDDDGGDVARREPRALEAHPRLAHREAAIHHHPRGAALDHERVARAAAAQRSEAHADTLDPT